MDQHNELGPLHWGGFDYGELRGYHVGLCLGRFTLGLSLDWRTG